MDSDDGDSYGYLGSLEVHSIGNKDRVIWVRPEVQGRVIEIEFETWSAVSPLPYKQYKERFGHVKLAKSSITLKTYAEERWSVMQVHGPTKKITLQVVEVPGTALFGRD